MILGWFRFSDERKWPYLIAAALSSCQWTHTIAYFEGIVWNPSVLPFVAMPNLWSSCVGHSSGFSCWCDILFEAAWAIGSPKLSVGGLTPGDKQLVLQISCVAARGRVLSGGEEYSWIGHGLGMGLFQQNWKWNLTLCLSVLWPVLRSLKTLHCLHFVLLVTTTCGKLGGWSWEWVGLEVCVSHVAYLCSFVFCSADLTICCSFCPG